MTVQPGSERATWQVAPVRARTADQRAAVLAAAREREVEVRTYFDPPLHRMPAFSGAPAGDLERTQALAATVVCLPMAEDLSDAELERITSSLGAVGGTA